MTTLANGRKTWKSKYMSTAEERLKEVKGGSMDHVKSIATVI